MPLPTDVHGSSGPEGTDTLERQFQRTKLRIRKLVGEDVFSSWFAQMQFDGVQEGVLSVTMPTQFLRNWIQNHYRDMLQDSAAAEMDGVDSVQIGIRERGNARTNRPVEPVEARAPEAPAPAPQPNGPLKRDDRRPGTSAGLNAPDNGNLDGSPLEKRYTFDSFVVGSSNRMAHAACQQIAETPLGELRYNPLFIHSGVGMGKTHLLHAVAWEMRRRYPAAKIVYMTAEYFRYRFVEAVRSQGALAFKEKLRGIDMLLIDDMEFLQGDRTELEFDHTLNAMLDGGKQVVVASARAPMQLDSLDARMRSRLSGGLITEIGTFDYELRLKVLERRVEERRLSDDPSFSVPGDVLSFLAERITDGGRQLDGTVTKLFVACHKAGEAITVERAEREIRDLMRGTDPRRIRIEDILRVVSKHYGVTKSDILSKRRHRSVVWPRQVGMWLAKNMTTRSLPDIGRRFGNRDHTTVLHAVRKIQGELEGNSRLRLEIEDLKRLIDT